MIPPRASVEMASSVPPPFSRAQPTVGVPSGLSTCPVAVPKLEVRTDGWGEAESDTGDVDAEASVGAAGTDIPLPL